MKTEPPATVLADRYALDEELGRSGTGMVWKATDTLLQRAVAVKLMHPELCDDPTFAESLAEQVPRVAALSAPAVARLLDTGKQDGVVFLVREHVEGMSARTLLERDGPRPVREAARIVARTLDGLAAAHEAGVLHLDLELDDVLVSSDGEVRVTDLGIGAALHASRRGVEASGRPGRADLPPEQRSGGAVDQRADVFAAGALLFELVTGSPPRGRTSARELRPDVPRELDRAIATALAPAPSDRFADARAFAAALEPFAFEPLTLAAEPIAAGRPAPRERWLRAWLLAPLAIVAGAAALIGAGLWFGRLEVGGPLGIRPAAPEPSPDGLARPAPVELRPTRVWVLDPFGDGQENDSNLGLSVDADGGTAWRSENYFDGRLNKPGVGLVFDLGRAVEVTGFRLWAPHPGYAIRLAVGDDPGALIDALGPPIATTAETSGPLQGSGRYVLLWFTSVVPTGDGNRVEVSEFVALVSAGA